MKQVYLEEYKGPLYAFIEFKVAGLNVISAAGGYQAFEGENGISLDHVVNMDGGDKYITNVVMSFSYTKESTSNRGGKTWGIGQEFNISIFDDSAIYVENIIAETLSNVSLGANCHIEYGWSADGKKIDERCSSFEGILSEYTISFEGASTVLSIVGTTTQVVELGTTYISGDGTIGEQSTDAVTLSKSLTGSGDPAHILIGIFQMLNEQSDNTGIRYIWDETTVIETAPVYAEEKVPKNLFCDNRALSEYIKDVLCPNAESLETGETGYVFYTKADEADSSLVWVYFKPQESVDNKLLIQGEDGSEISVDAVNNHEGEITRVYNYYGGFQKSEVLSFSSEFKGIAVNAGARVSSAVDSYTNELISCEAADSEDDSKISATSTKRIMGISSGTYSSLNTAMRDLWNKYATQVYSASLEILGDPNIGVMDHIKVNVYTKYGQLHHTSGEYIVQSVEDSVDSSGFTTSLTLLKRGVVGEFSTNEYQEMVNSGIQESEIQHNSGVLNQEGSTTDTQQRANAGLVNRPTDKASQGYPSSTEGYNPIVNDNSRGYPKSTDGMSSNAPKTGKTSKSYTKSDATQPKGSSEVANPVVYN